MAEDDIVSNVAERYASAMFDLAEEQGGADAAMPMLDRFAEALRQSPDLERLVRSPVFSADDQVKALGALLPKLGVTGTAANLFKLLARNRRLFLAADVVRGFRRRLAQKRGTTTAEVTSAEPLSAAQAEAVRLALGAKAGKTVDIEQRVDPSLIGGLVVKLGSRMIDTSLKTKLSQLRYALKEVR